MLTGMLVFGLVAALGVPLAMISGGGDPAPEVDDVLPDDTPEDELGDAEDEGRSFAFGVSDGARDLDVFRPGVDRIDVALPDWDVEFFVTGGPDEAPGLQIGSDPGATWMTFPGLAELPVSDIYVTVTDADGIPATHSLAELAGDGLDAVLRPVDPDEPDTVFGGDPGEGAIAPANPDRADTLPDDPSTEDPLQPVVDDDVVPLNAEAAVPVSSVVTVSADPLQWPVRIDGFDPGTDVLYFRLDADRFGAAPDVTVQPSVDGDSGEVRVNGDLIAVLHGAPDATFDDLLVEMIRTRAA